MDILKIRLCNEFRPQRISRHEKDAVAKWKKMNVLCVEMESLSLYCNAVRLGKKALTLLTISDLPLKGEAMPADERRTGFTVMLEAALQLAVEADA